MRPASSAAKGDQAIRCHELGKQYRIGGPRERYLSLRDRLVDVLTRPFRRDRTAASDFWALRGVSFDVHAGERVGIIGRNGAGKSTLLKLLSRITEPTEGGFEIRGRVASLLEVGTGFHPELTGRENVFLSGAILGMRKSEVKAKFDEIVDFAEMGPFLDTPAKRYSSGMYMRLAFAVAAHLDPEILLVDEVLAVGDAQFQQKCLGQMNRVSNSGRTILFVSHQMPAVQALCERAILLSGGGIAAMGPTRDVIGTYLSGGNQPQGAKLDVSTCRDRTRFSEMAIKEVWIENDQGSLASVVGMGEGLTLCYRFEASRCIFNPGFGFGIDDHNGVRLFSANNYFGPQSKIPRSASQGVVRCRFAALPLLPATYHVSMSLVEDNRMIVDYLERVVSFTLEPRDVLGSGKIPRPDQGIFFLPAKIDIEV